MTQDMLDVLVKAVSTPSWVDILLLIVTTAYFVATVFVYRANKKMAKAAEDQIKTATTMAELSRNVELYDKRMEIIEYVNTHYEWELSSSKDFKIKLGILFPSKEVLSEFLNLQAYRKLIDCCNAEMEIFMKNSKDLSVRYVSLSNQIENALSIPLNIEEVQRTKNLASENIVVIQEGAEGPKQINLFDIIERRVSFKQEIANSKVRLLEKMGAFIENTISIKSA